MTGTVAPDTMADMAATDPILSTAELNLELAARRLAVRRQCECSGTLADLCEQFISAPSPQVRELILRSPVKTRGDAIAALSIIESNAEDSHLCVHLIAGLRVYLAA
jgi:hypothetical protein